MRNQMGIALRFMVVTLVLTGLLYPLAVTGAAKLFFPRKAAGSLVKAEDGRMIGSALIGQSFAAPGYFHPRPSASGYDATASGGSNLGPTSGKLRDKMKEREERLRREAPGATGNVPVELLTASASGLDPHVSPEAALWQAPRVARARGVSEQRVRSLILDYVEGRGLGFLGERRVNVLALNRGLDAYFGPRPDMEK
jgi:K+-transporting ATPase ATPase C chain